MRGVPLEGAEIRYAALEGDDLLVVDRVGGHARVARDGRAAAPVSVRADTVLPGALGESVRDRDRSGLAPRPSERTAR